MRAIADLGNPRFDRPVTVFTDPAGGQQLSQTFDRAAIFCSGDGPASEVINVDLRFGRVRMSPLANGHRRQPALHSLQPPGRQAFW